MGLSNARAHLLLATLVAAGGACAGGAETPPGTDAGTDAASPGNGGASGDAAGGAPANGSDAAGQRGDDAASGRSGDGSAGGPPDAPAESPPPTPRSCGTFALCDDFESAPVGGPPDPTRWTVGAPNVTGTGALAIDDAQHHGGARAVKVTGQGGYSNHVFLTNAGAIAKVGPVVWARFYLRLAGELGDGHVTFAAMKDTADGGKYLRMGGQSKILMWNRESDDATLPALSPAGIAQSRALPPNQWLCVEFMIDGAQGRMQTWIDGVELAGLHLDGTPTPDTDEQWLRKPGWRPTLTDFALGWESYAGQALTLWFDDVALDGARLGCS